MSEPARILINRDGATFEISGSESFVKEQIESFRETILQAVSSNELPGNPKTSKLDELNGKQDFQVTNSDVSSYPNLLHFEEDVVTILKNIPGPSNPKSDLPPKKDTKLK
ncbi:MAG: hypothetical protein IPM21_10345 [Acidobacteria bacterium]|nr:hypothetical protein [Acidobacteriota bacterium]